MASWRAIAIATIAYTSDNCPNQMRVERGASAALCAVCRLEV